MKKTLFLALFLLAAPAFLLAETPQNPEKPKHYTVQKGDCLWNISKDLYGDPLDWPMLYMANQGKIHNPNLIYPGQKFSVPLHFTKEDLKKATILANEKAQSGVVPLSHEEPSALTRKVQPEKEAQLAPKEAPASAPEKATNPVAATEENKAASAQATNSNFSSAITIVIVALLTLIGGILLWRKSKESGSTLQEPRPLSTFPEMKETPVAPSTPVSSVPSKPSTPSESAPIASSPVTPPITPVPAATPPSVEAPAQPPTPETTQAQLPLTPPPTSPEEDKPSDNQVPPASPGHAA